MCYVINKRKKTFFQAFDICFMCCTFFGRTAFNRNYAKKRKYPKLIGSINFFRKFQIRINMWAILDDNLEIEDTVQKDLNYLLCLEHLFRSKAVANLHSKKNPWQHVHTMLWVTI